MKRKWIEIVCGARSAVAVLAALLAAVAPADAAQRRPASEHTAEAFAVHQPSTAWAQPLDPLPGVPGAIDAGRADEHFVPDISYSFFWAPQDSLRWRAREYARRQAVSEHSPGLLGAFETARVDTPRTRWLPRPSTDSWAFGERNWRNELDDGTRLLLGSSEIAVPEWNESVRLGGISLSQSFLARSDDVSQWNYSLAFGAVDQSSTDSAGDLVFGPKAGNLAVNYAYNPQFSVETHTEVASNLLMSDISGEYDLGGLGRWRSGVARSTHGLEQGWRYRAMADFDVAHGMSLGWMGERYTDGFMDIRRYAGGSAATAGGRHRWSASWDAGRWGEWSGSLENVRDKQGTQQRRFGISQQFWYSPNLQIGIHAKREVVADDYDIGLRFSFPLY